MRNAVIRLLSEVGIDYLQKGIAEFEIREAHDVHAYYRLTKDPSKVIHVQGYPGMSSDEEARVWARLMDYNKMMEIRQRSHTFIGNEHEATIRQLPNFLLGISIPYDPSVLEAKLEESVPELKAGAQVIENGNETTV